MRRLPLPAEEVHKGYRGVSEGYLLRGLANLLIVVLIPIPSILSAVWLQQKTPHSDELAWLHNLGLEHPVQFVCVLYLVNVCVLMWGCGVLQSSVWLIDLYWTLLVPLVTLFYRLHPRATFDPLRSYVSMVLVATWSIRLTHNYLRREGYRLGEREDWRYADMRKRWPGSFWLSSIFLVYAIQGPMLIGITLPIYATHFDGSQRAFGGWDTFFAVAGLAFLSLACLADSQLHRYVQAKKRGNKVPPVLDWGCFAYSRHPNYVGEMGWWWCVAGFGCVVGQPWTALGQAFNHAIMFRVQSMTQQRMMSDPSRAVAYAAYCEKVPAWLPFGAVFALLVRRKGKAC
jgi:steroid 5-alpha reductase family enzyme